MASIIKRLTPAATARIITRFGMAGTCSASTWRSGSAMVIMIPKTKPEKMGQTACLDLLISMPMPSPMGVMARSAPRVKIPMPKIRSRAPNRKRTRVSAATGAIVILSISTIAVIGRTESSDSNIFSLSFFSMCSSFLLCKLYYYNYREKIHICQ